MTHIRSPENQLALPWTRPTRNALETARTKRVQESDVDPDRTRMTAGVVNPPAAAGLLPIRQFPPAKYFTT